LAQQCIYEESFTSAKVDFGCRCLHRRSLSRRSGTIAGIGDKAPLIEGKDQDGKTWKLADEVGKKIVLLYFYPKDDTPGCTKEACGFRDRIADLKKDNVEVIGVSFDSPESHQKFISKYNLNFPLLADTDGKIADTYGVRMPTRQWRNE